MFKSQTIKYRIIDFYPNSNVRELNIGFARSVKPNEVEKVLELLGNCFDLLKAYFPQKFKDMTRDVKKIYVTGKLKVFDAPNARAAFLPDIKGIALPINLFILTEEDKYRIEFIASLIIHEAQHARLHRLGFSSNRNMLGRQEKICYTLQRRFGCKLKNGLEIVEYCDYALSVDLEKYYSSEEFLVRQITALESENVPNWVKKFGTRMMVKKYKKINNINKKPGPEGPVLACCRQSRTYRKPL